MKWTASLKDSNCKTHSRRNKLLHRSISNNEFMNFQERKQQTQIVLFMYYTKLLINKLYLIMKKSLQSHAQNNRGNAF